MGIVNGSLQVGKKDSIFFSANPTLVLLDGQLIYNETTGDLFIGDGITQLSSLTAINGGVGAGVWGSITGTLSNQTDLQTALNTKVNKGTLTTNTIPKATASDTIGNSSITDDGTIVTFNNDIKLNGASKRIYTPNEIGYFKATNTNIGFEFIGTTNTAGISSNETQNSFYHDAQNSFDAPLHDFNNSVRLSSLTASTVPYIDASNNIVSSSVTPTQLGYLDATSSIQTQLNAKLSSTKERLLFIGGFAAINPADGLTYYSGEVGASVATTTQSSYKFQFNENCTITRAVIMLRQVTNASNESVSFYLRASGSTDNTITTTLDMNSIGASTNKVFVYSGLNISVTAGTDYENKMLCPTWATNPTSVVAVIKYYGY